MTKRKDRKAKPTAEDVAAAKRLKQRWLAMPRARRPTQDKLAAAWGEGGSQSQISQYLTGTIPLNLRAVMFFSSQFGCDPKEIYPTLPGLQHYAVKPSATHVVEESHPVTLFGIQLSIEAARLGEQFDKLVEPQRSVIRELIYLAVTDQVQLSRATTPQPKRTKGRRGDERPRVPS